MSAIPVCPYCHRVHCICGSGPGRPPFAPAPSVLGTVEPVDVRDLRAVPTDVLTAWVDWKALERSMSTPGPVYCSHCGAANQAGSTYCAGCGKMLNP